MTSSTPKTKSSGAGSGARRRIARARDRVPLLDRIGRRVKRFERLARIPAFGLGIVICSIMTPVTAQRAATWSGRGGGHDQGALQNLTVREQIVLADLAEVSQDIRLFGLYAEHVNSARVLKSQVKSKRVARDPRLRDRLSRQAQAERDLASGLYPQFQSENPAFEQGKPAFDPAGALDYLTANDTELGQAQNDRQAERAADAHDKAASFTGVAALWAAGVFFFTLAYITRRASHPRRIFATAGVSVVAVALLGMGALGF